MSSENRERSLADVERTFYDLMSKNTVFSSLNRSAFALEKLANNTKNLTEELRNANESSAKLTKSLNRITLAAVVISAATLGVEIYKLCTGS